MSFFKAQRVTLYRLVALAVFGIVVTFVLLSGLHYRETWRSWRAIHDGYDWEHRTPKYPVPEADIVHPPDGTPLTLRRIQHDFSKDPKDEKHEKTQKERRDAVLDALKKSWGSYQKYAWGHDELKPQSLTGKDPFNGWAATLVDSLDVLWIAGMKTEFKAAVGELRRINWDNSTKADTSVFETNIRYLGGLLSAYDLSEDKVLLEKATELGHMLYAAFDTPNHMPVGTMNFEDAKAGKLIAGTRTSLAVIGTLSMEFTRLSQLTGNPKWYTAIDRIKDNLVRTQNDTKLPGMWPVHMDISSNFTVDDNSFSLGGSADSGFEYLPKMYALLGGLDPSYKDMHIKAMATAQKHLVFSAMLPADSDKKPPSLLFSGTVKVGKEPRLSPDVQHLGCFTGGHFALGGKLFDNADHVKIGEQIARGCAWIYNALPTGVMPESSTLIPCNTADLALCEWDEKRWEKEGRSNFPKGIASMGDPHYYLRPEAIESIFLLYRMTGKKDLLDTAWRMFQSIREATETEHAFSAIDSVNVQGGTSKRDSMESFWIAETLKYLYLIFSEPDLISLDDYVFNTEAHPFKIPKPKPGST